MDTARALYFETIDDDPEGGLTMPWMGIDDQLHGNRKFRKLREDRWACTGYWATCGSWCASSLTDGFIPDYVLEDWDPDHRMSRRLVEVGLWLRATRDGEEGYQFHDWLQYNLPAEKIREKRAMHAERQERYRQRLKDRAAGLIPPDGPGGGDRPERGQSPVTNGVTHASGDASRDGSPDASRATAEVPTPIPSHPIPSLSTERTTSVDAPRRRAPAADPEGFDEFWAVCPRKVSKGNARKAYAKALARRGAPTPAQLRDAMARAARFWKISHTETQFIPHPASWLNAERWEDQLPEPGTALASRRPGAMAVGGETADANGGLGGGTAARKAANFLNLRRGPQ